MAESISEHAPAKINLALHITGQRSDHYHLLHSLVVFTEEGDHIHVRPSPCDTFSITGPFSQDVPDNRDNLVLRARDLIRNLAGKNGFPVHIELEKNLPVASGIGGGSSDAAATLRALARLWDLPLSTPSLVQAALSIGADVPMCLAAETLIASGIGEVLTPVSGLPTLALVLVNPNIAIATPAVFSALENRNNAPLPFMPLPWHGNLASVADWLSTTRNDLEVPAQKIVPEIATTLSTLDDTKPVLARMSGAGATCFGLYLNTQDATDAARAIAARHPSWYVVATTTLA